MPGKFLLLALTVVVFRYNVTAQTSQPNSAAASTRTIKYGSNPDAGSTFIHDGVKLYYEVYGSGEPLVLVHGNGGSIGDFSAQISYFRKLYKVIAMDSRDQGKSADSPDTITYEKMTDDIAALIDHLHTGPVYVLGWSDGGVEALLLGVRHPSKVNKIAAMAANVTPDGLHPDVIALIHQMLSATKADQTRESRRERKVTQMMLDEPHVEFSMLETIKAPTLVLASDHDAIRDEHTLDIYHHVPNSQLVIFPNATHMIPYDDPDLFNATVERFFRTPFVKKDRIQDMLKSLEAAKASTN